MHPIPDPDPCLPAARSPQGLLLGLASRFRGLLAWGVGFGVACTVAQGLIPLAIGRAVDTGLVGRDRSALTLWGVAVLLFGVVQAATGILRDRCSVTARLGAAYLVMQVVTRHVSRLGGRLAERASTGDLVAIGAADIGRIGAALAGTARGGGAVVSIVVVATVMLVMSAPLGLVVLAGVPVTAWTVARCMRLLHRRQQEVRRQQAELTRLTVDIVDGLRVLRGIGGEAVFAERYRNRSQQARRLGVRLATVDALVACAKVLLPGLLVAAVVWLGAVQVGAGRLGVGTLVAFYGFAVFLSEQLGRVATLVDQVTRALVAARRVVDLLALDADPPQAPESPTGEPASGSGDLVDPVTGLRVPSGRCVGVVCASPDDATEFADRLRPRRVILVEDARSWLFSGVLRRELDLHGRARDDEALLWAAVDAASARDVVEALPAGLDSVVLGAGREFSGGQQQRLRLVRALMADPEVLVLVEPTNALDAHTEGRIAERLAGYRAGRTTVVFTTSPILLSHTDHVVLVRDCRVVAEGRHEDLLRDPAYHAVVAREVAEV